MVKLNVFDEMNEPVYRLQFRQEVGIAEVKSLPAPTLVALFFQDLLESVQDESSFADNFAFNHQVF